MVLVCVSRTVYTHTQSHLVWLASVTEVLGPDRPQLWGPFTCGCTTIPAQLGQGDSESRV